jgi:hypothetical protein
LAKIGSRVAPNLRALAEMSSDAETRRRAKAVHDEIQMAVIDQWSRERAAEETRLRNVVARETAFGIDYFVERLIRDRDKLTDDDWAVLSR